MLMIFWFLFFALKTELLLKVFFLHIFIWPYHSQMPKHGFMSRKSCVEKKDRKKRYSSAFYPFFWNDFFAFKVNCFILFNSATLFLNCNLFFPCIFLNFHLVQLMLVSRFKQFKFTNFVLHHVFYSLNPNNYQIV